MIGEAGVPHDDTSYTGDTGESVFSVQHYRNQAREFQAVMDSMDAVAQSLRKLQALDLDPETAAQVASDLNEFEGKKVLFRGAAQAINAASYAINAAGGRFPVLQVPSTLQGLGLGPAIPLAAIAALATAATLISWGRDWMTGVNRRLHDDRMLAAITDPEQRAAAAQAIMEANAAKDRASTSPLAQLATVAKWGAIAVLAYMGWRMWQNR